MEQAHGGWLAALGVGNVGVHVVGVGAEPVKGRALGLEGGIVAAKGQVVHKGAGVGGILFGHQSGDGQAAAELGTRLPARAHDDGGVHGTGVADEVGAAQEGAHGVAHQHKLGAGEGLLDAAVEGIGVVHHRVPGVTLAEIDGGVPLAYAVAVAQVVMAHHGEAMVAQEAGKMVVAGDMLADTVENLHHGPHVPLRAPLHSVEPGFAVGGEKGEFRQLCHGQTVLSVIYC